MNHLLNPPGVSAQSPVGEPSPTTPSPHWPTRQPWVAGLMSLALPGWGQLYNGEANRAIWFFLLFSLLLLPGTAVLALAVPPLLMAPALVLGVLAALGLWLYGAADAYRAARRQVGFIPRPWQTSGLYVLVFIACALLVLPALTIAMRAHLVQPFRIPSSSMAPSLLPGDLVFADMHYNSPHGRAVQRGDVAIFTYPNDRTQYYVKRIVALPGDRIAVLNHRWVLNGQPLAVGDPVAGVQAERAGAKTWPVQGVNDTPDDRAEQTVPPGHVYVLGDHRTNSIDSRQFGPVPLADVVGRVRQIWFSADAGAVRWARIGALVD